MLCVPNTRGAPEGSRSVTSDTSAHTASGTTALMRVKRIKTVDLTPPKQLIHQQRRSSRKAAGRQQEGSRKAAGRQQEGSRKAAGRQQEGSRKAAGRQQEGSRKAAGRQQEGSRKAARRQQQKGSSRSSSRSSRSSSSSSRSRSRRSRKSKKEIQEMMGATSLVSFCPKVRREEGYLQVGSLSPPQERRVGQGRLGRTRRVSVLHASQHVIDLGFRLPMRFRYFP